MANNTEDKRRTPTYDIHSLILNRWSPRSDLEIPDNFDVMAMIAISKKGTKDQLPPQLQEREYPTDRKPLKGRVCFIPRFEILKKITFN
jgi:hypothetical protein